MKTSDQIPAEFKMAVQGGKEHVTYDGLLNMAHAEGLCGIETELLQAPTEANGQTAICKATVTITRQDGGHIFTGIGDANPRNTNKLIALHAIRMAETRAKARALRDALNIKGCAFEELGGGDEMGAKPAASTSASAPEPMATDAQKAKIAQGCEKLGWDAAKKERFLVTFWGKTSAAQLSQAHAEEAIAKLRAAIEKKQAAQSAA